MGQIVIHRAGTQINLSLTPALIFITRAEHKKDINSVDQLNISLESELPLEFKLQDSIYHEGRRFRLNTIPRIIKEGETRYSYDLIFESAQYDLIRKKMFNYDLGGFKNTLNFPLTGPIETHLQMLINNANRDKTGLDATWVLGTYPTGSETKTLVYSNENCLQVLQKICGPDAYETEFEILENIATNTYTLNIKKIGVILPYSFSYGMKKGLYKLERSLESNGIVTKLFVYGSSENLPSNYRNFSDRLRMPEIYGDAVFDQAMIDAFGLVEESQMFEDIKPTFTGVITSVSPVLSTAGQTSFIANNMDFDLNEKKPDGSTKYLMAGTPAKISIKKGNLAGYEFEISSYNHTTKTFKINPFKDARDLVFPGTDPVSIFKLSPNDEFTILDIIMPQTYIDAAELKLKNEGVKAYAEVTKDKVKYILDVDPFYLQDLGPETTTFMKVGDYVNVKDVPLGIDKNSRIISLTRDLLNLFKYTLDIADDYVINPIQSLITDIKVIDTKIDAIKVKNKEALLEGYRRMELLKDLIFDPDGYFDPANIKPLSIETNMLSVGARSQQLNLDNVIFTPNYLSNPNSIQISAGTLNHYSIDPAGIKSWGLLEINKVSLIPSNSYYIYAKVLRSGTSGSYNITTDKIKFDSDPDYFNFLIAVLFPVTSGMRFIELMYGATYINGRTIKTGRISSVDGLTWFDLDTGEIRGKIEFSDYTLDQLKVGGENLLTIDSNEFIDLDKLNNSYWKSGNDYVISADVLNTTIRDVRLVLILKDDNNLYTVKTYKDVTLKNVNERLHLKFNEELKNYKRAFFKVIQISNDEVVPIDKVKLEYGNIPSSYSPSYLDTYDRIEQFEKSVNWFNTTISGNVVATGTLLLGNYETGTNAGISGIGTVDEVFFWAGSTFSNRNTAPIRFYRNGSGYLKNVTIEGILKTGRIGGPDGWIIDEDTLTSSKGKILFDLQYTDSSGKKVYGFSLSSTNHSTPSLKNILTLNGYVNDLNKINLPASISAVGRSGSNIALSLSAYGGNSPAGVIDSTISEKDVALEITGNIVVDSKKGFTGIRRIEKWDVEVTRGIITNLTFID